MAKLKHMFKKTAVLFRDREDRNQEKKEPSAPEGLWLKCPKCGEVVYRDDVKAHGYVCPKCEGYFRIGTRTRIRMVADTGTFQEWFTDLETENPLLIGFSFYTSASFSTCSIFSTNTMVRSSFISPSISSTSGRF